MGAEPSATVAAKQAPKIDPLVKARALAPTPTQKPKHPVTVKDKDGQDVILGDPAVTRSLVALMDLHAVNGGAACHWGGPAALAETMSAIHGMMFKDNSSQWHQQYNFVNDAGHTENGVYALRANLGFDNMTFEDLKGFRSIQSKFTGHGEAHLNPEGVLISNGPLGSSLPQAQGLCLGDKALGNARTTVCVISDGGSMEGEAKEAFSAIPGLAGKGKMNPFVLVVSDNNTKLSGRIDDDSYSMQPSFAAMPALGWDTKVVENAHDLQRVYTELESAVEKAKGHPDKPVCLIMKTIKGYGVKSTEESAAGGHGYPLKKNDAKIVDFVSEIHGGNPPQEIKAWAESLANPPQSGNGSSGAASAVKRDKVQAGVAKAMIRAAEEGLPLFSVSADLQGSTGVAPFQKTFPGRFVEVGVAEANMVSTAAGLSLSGFIPVVDTFARFGVSKGNLPLIMSALSLAPVIAVFSHTGFQDAADGASHQATTYFASVSAIPQTQVVCCSCSQEAEALTYQAIVNFAKARKQGKVPDHVVLFVGRENYPEYYVEKADYQWGRAQVLKEGKDVVLVATGPMVEKTLEAADALKGKGIEATVVNNAFINRPDLDTIGALLKKCGGRLVTAEDHQIIGGMGAQLTHSLARAGHTFKTATLGINGSFGQSAYKADHLYEKHGLLGKDIAAAAERLCR